MENNVKLSSLIKYFHYESINDIFISPCEILGVYRPGLELIGFLDYMEYNKGIILGRKEIEFIKSINNELKQSCFELLTNERIPFILIADDMNCFDKLIELTKQKGIPLLKTNKDVSVVFEELSTYIYAKFTPKTKVHGTLIDVFGTGVLLIGESGIGKSEIALELVKKGHQLISDDSVITFKKNRHIHGKAPEHIKGFLEVRGIGIINLYRMFGVVSVKDTTTIDIIISLQKKQELENAERLIHTIEKKNMLDIDIPLIRLPVSEGRSMSNLVETATMNYMIQKKGYNANDEFVKKYDRLVEGEEDDD